MCGILCCLSDDIETQPALVKDACPVCHNYENKKSALLYNFLASRGPNVSSSSITTTSSTNGSVGTIIHLSGNVLWTQGLLPEPQPYVDSFENHYFLFNGDLYNRIPNDVKEINNDGLHLFEAFKKLHDEQELLERISEFRGPFAFIYYNKLGNKLWFGRDFFGRESLLMSYDEDYPNSILISSVSVLGRIFEVPTFGIFCYKLQEKEIIAYEWNSHPRDVIVDDFVKFTTCLKEKDIHVSIHPKIRTQCIPTLLKNTTLSNVKEDPVLLQLISLESENAEKLLYRVSQILDDKVNRFLVHLRSAVQKRVQVQPPYCKNCVELRDKICTHSKIGILFSGGIDSMVLAYLAAECLSPGESIDLLNVAFYQDTHDQSSKIQIPDRQTGLEAYELLKSKFNNLQINFIQVNVNKSEVEELRQKRIHYLISPLKSVLDDSLGCCLWFAARGNNDSPARILLLGSGADELLGGYSRHRRVYECKGWEGLLKEMQLEIDRISLRNLGRDNRILSDHGVAPRMPFLDEDVVKFLTGDCDLWLKCCPLPQFSRGLGEKLLLRTTLLKLLGPQNTHLALLPKRAMQFGSRIAKLENSKEKGGDECKRLNQGCCEKL